MEEIEIWRRFRDTDYEVSNLGRVKSLKKKKPLIMKPGVDKDGYFRVDICHNLTIKHYHVHRLVAFCFVENAMGYPQVNHKDTIKQNNNSSNLEWCTALYNTQHATLLGLMKGKKGSDNLHAKITAKDVIEILLSSEPPEMIAPHYGISFATVYDIRNRRSWSHLCV